MKSNLILTKFIGALSFLGLATSAYSQTIKAQVNTLPSSNGSYWFEASNLTYVSGGSGVAFGGSAELFCIEPTSSAPSNGSNHTYDLRSASEVFRLSSGAEKGEAALNWLFDTYYDDLFLSANGVSSNDQTKFQNTLWELVIDYSGWTNSLNLSSGSYTANTNNSIFNNLKSEIGSLDSDYRSVRFELQFLEDQRGSYQNMILVTERSSDPIPEPSSVLLVGLGMLACASRRSR